MNTKMIVAALVGSVIAFFLGWLVFGILLGPFYENHTIHYKGLMRDETQTRLYAIYLAQLCWCGLLAYVFDRWANIRSFGPGLMGGLIMGALIFTASDLMTWSMMNLMGCKMMIVNIIANTLYMGVMGGIVAHILGMGKKSA
jgi:hypothetical protein